MLHDDGHLPENLERRRHLCCVGISRTSKTPTSIYLANRGFKTANVPLVPGVPLPPQARSAHQRVRRRRWWRAPSAFASAPEPHHRACARSSRRLCRPRGDRRRDRRRRGSFARGRGWPVIDVTRRSIEETAAAIIRLYQDRGSPGLGSMSRLLARRPAALDPRFGQHSAGAAARSCGPCLHCRAAGTRRGAMRQAVSGEDGLDPQDIAEVLARAKAEAVSDIARRSLRDRRATRCWCSATRSCPSRTAWRRRAGNCSISAARRHTSIARSRSRGRARRAGRIRESATLTMRKLSPEFIGRYLAAAGEEVLDCGRRLPARRHRHSAVREDRRRLFLHAWPAAPAAARCACGAKASSRAEGCVFETRLRHRLAGRAFALPAHPSLLAAAIRHRRRLRENRRAAGGARGLSRRCCANRATRAPM